MLVQVELSRIIIDEKRQDQIIVLKEREGERQFPIVIGFLEASSIKMKLSGLEVPRPMTHDLLVGVIHGLGAEVKRLIIDKLEESTFHAKLEIKKGSEKVKKIDCRPSDGIALAVRVGCDIYVDEEILKNTALPKNT